MRRWGVPRRAAGGRAAIGAEAAAEEEEEEEEGGAVALAETAVRARVIFAARQMMANMAMTVATA